jgi:hypothetical protein
MTNSFEGVHAMSLRRRFAATIWAVALAAIVTSACAPSDGDAETEALSQPPLEPTAVPTVMPTPEPPDPEPPAPPTPAPAVTKAPASAASALRPTSSATFFVGNTQGRGMPMRTAPVPTERGKLWPDGTTMKGLGGEREAYGWTWSWVQDPDGNAGWMPNNFLIPAAGSPAGIGSEAVPTLVLAPAEPPTVARPTTMPPTVAQPTTRPSTVGVPKPMQSIQSLSDLAAPASRATRLK